MRNHASALHILFQAQFAASWLLSKDTSLTEQKQILWGGAVGGIHCASVRQLLAKRAAVRRSTPYLLFKNQQKHPGKSQAATNIKTSSTII